MHVPSNSMCSLFSIDNDYIHYFSSLNFVAKFLITRKLARRMIDISLFSYITLNEKQQTEGEFF